MTNQQAPLSHKCIPFARQFERLEFETRKEEKSFNPQSLDTGYWLKNSTEIESGLVLTADDNDVLALQFSDGILTRILTKHTDIPTHRSINAQQTRAHTPQQVYLVQRRTHRTCQARISNNKGIFYAFLLYPYV